jgi:hypothetical protein
MSSRPMSLLPRATLHSDSEQVSSKGPEWMGIHHHEQDIGLPSKWVFSFSTRGYGQVLLIICVVKQNKKELSVCRLKINNA